MAEQTTKDLAHHLDKLLWLARCTVREANTLARRGAGCRELVARQAFAALLDEVKAIDAWAAGEQRRLGIDGRTVVEEFAETLRGNGEGGGGNGHA